jgi:hypothetical protein
MIRRCYSPRAQRELAQTIRHTLSTTIFVGALSSQGEGAWHSLRRSASCQTKSVEATANTSTVHPHLECRVTRQMLQLLVSPLMTYQCRRSPSPPPPASPLRHRRRSNGSACMAQKKTGRLTDKLCRPSVGALSL